MRMYYILTTTQTPSTYLSVSLFELNYDDDGYEYYKCTTIEEFADMASYPLAAQVMVF
jgi:hypothetical protein